MRAQLIWEVAKTFFYRRSPKVRMVLAAVAQELVDRMEDCPRGKTLVIMTGMSLSGKTTYVDNHPQLKGFGQIRTRDIHDALNSNLAFLQDDNSIRGRAYWVRQFLTEAVREDALRQALDRGIALVLDSCHLTRKKRLTRYQLAKQYGYRVVIVYVECPWMTLLSRAAASDDKSVARGGKRVWVDLIRQQAKVFEPPTSDEADQLIPSKYEWMSIRLS